MNIQYAALIGLGSMGVFFAPKIEAYLGHDNFVVIADGKRKERLEQKGVTLNGVNHRFKVRTPEETGRFADLIIIATKAPEYGQALEDIRNLVGPDTQILPILNGIESEERAAAVYGWEHVLYSYIRVSIALKDGIANYDPAVGRVFFGEEKNDTLSDRVRTIRDFFTACGINHVIDQDMKLGIWNKFMCNVSENLTCALLGIPYAAFAKSEYANNIRHAAMREVIAIANAKGIALSEEDILKQDEYILTLPQANRPSTLQDLDNERKTEVDLFAGTMIRMGKDFAIPTPICWMFLQGIRVLEEKNDHLFH